MSKNYTFYRNNFPSSDGLNRIACYFYIPIKSAPRAVLQISHGMCEYLRRYEPFADYLCDKGYIVCGNDHLGHGDTATSVEDLGFTAKGGGAEFMVDDVYTLTQKLRTDFEGLPIVLLGHSMGSFIARRYLEKYPNAVDAAILSGTGGPNNPTGFGKALTRFLMLFYGERHRSDFIQKVAMGSYNDHFREENSSFSWVTRDRNITNAYANDPFCNFTFTLRGYYDLFYLLGKVSDRNWAGKLKRDLPILMVSGDQDPVGNYGKGVIAIYNRLISSGMTDVTLKLYPGARHEMLNEINQSEVFDDIAEWLDLKIRS